MAEEWRPVREFPDHYEISSEGRLRRSNPYRPSHADRIRKVQYDRNGYAVYMLSVSNAVRLRSAHRLVADAFLGPIPEDRHVNHKNGIKSDPRLENLELVTISENRAHSYRVLGIKPNVRSGLANHNARLSSEQVSEIRARYAKGGESYSLLAKAFSTTKQTIARIVKNRSRLEG